MKTKFLKKKIKLYFLFFVFIFTVVSCNDCHEMSFGLNEEFTTRSDSFDFCNTKEAVFKSISEYNTDNGEAILNIPIPKGHRLKKVKQTKKLVKFVTIGEKFSNEFTTYTVKITGLSKTSGTILTVNLDIDGTSEDRCGISTKGEKKKTSEVTGQPFWKNVNTK